MKRSEALFTALIEQRLIARLIPDRVEQCVRAYEVLKPFGVVLEVALKSDNALVGIDAILKAYPDALILAGNVVTVRQAESAIGAGATGIVTTDFFDDVVDTCVKNGAICIPSGLADVGKQLVQKARAYGCELEILREKYPYQWIYRLFPAVSGASSNVAMARSWRSAYESLALVYAGGIRLENLPELVNQDPQGIFCGTALTRHVDTPERMKADVEAWLDAIHGVGREMEPPVEIRDDVPHPQKKVVSFGEVLMRLSAPDHLRFVQARRFETTFGGAEANTAVAFANYGLRSVFVTVLPEHEIGQMAVNSLRSYGVDTINILRQGQRIGIYFLEHGASQRPTKVIYDRKGSALAELRPGQVDWKSILRDADWFHWTGITPALGDLAAEVTMEAVKAAKECGVKVSVDLNYRLKLWSPEVARAVMTSLMSYVDVCIGTEIDTECIFGIRPESQTPDSDTPDTIGCQELATQLFHRFQLEKVAITRRESYSEDENYWSACLFTGSQFIESKKYQIQSIDRGGGGDSFSSGFIYGILTGKTDEEALEYGVAASCLKQTIHGNFNLVSIHEVGKLVGGHGPGGPTPR